MSEIDWDTIDQELADAAKATDDKLASRISSLTRLTDAELKQMFPKEADMKKLAELMAIVRGSTEHMQRVNELTANIERLGGTVVTLLQRFP